MMSERERESASGGEKQAAAWDGIDSLCVMIAVRVVCCFCAAALLSEGIE